MTDEELAAIIAVVTDAVTEAIGGQVQGYVDGRVDWVMAEVQAQILAFEEKVGVAFDQVASEMAQRITATMQDRAAENVVGESYKRWLMSQAVQWDVGMGEFAKVIAAAKAVEGGDTRADRDGDGSGDAEA